MRSRLVLECQVDSCGSTLEIPLPPGQAIHSRGEQPIAYHLRPEWAAKRFEDDNAATPEATAVRGGPPRGFAIVEYEAGKLAYVCGTHAAESRAARSRAVAGLLT